MAINHSAFFTRLGKGIDAAEKLLSATGATADTEYQAFIDAFNSDALGVKQAIEQTIFQHRRMQDNMANSIVSLLSTPIQNALYAYVDADRKISGGNGAKLLEFIRQMESAATDVDKCTISATPAAAGGNVGTGTVITSTKNKKGLENELMLAEAIDLRVTSTSGGVKTFEVRGEDAVAATDYRYPDGSGLATSIQSYGPTNGSNLLPTPIFDETDAEDTNVPLSWIATDADATGSITAVEVQTVIISGSPTGGTYFLTFTDANGNAQSTKRLPFDATSAEVQTALQELTGLENVTVSESGTTPNLTHTITFTDVPNPGQLTSTNEMTGGTPAIAHATTVAGTANTVHGASSLQIAGDGSEQTTYHIPVSLQPQTQYAFHALIKASTITTGVLQVALVDGINGTTMTDDQGTSNSFNVTLSSIGSGWYNLTGVFRTDSDLAGYPYVQLKCTTAIDASGDLFIDSVQMYSMSEAYAGGPSMIIVDGDTAWEVDDEITLTIANDYGGSIHHWMDRIFNLKGQGLLLPTDTAPATYPDTLIS